MNTETPMIENLVVLSPPIKITGWQEIILFGVAIYEMHFPGVKCISSTCPAEAYGGLGRYWGYVPPKHQKRVKELINQDIYGRYPINQFLEDFGSRQPTIDNPSGLSYIPGNVAGEVSLYFSQPPLYDILWPKWGQSMFISERLRMLFKQNNVTGLNYHPVKKMRVLGKNIFQKFVHHDWDKRIILDAIDSGIGESAEFIYYEVEEVEPEATCGLKWDIVCSQCFYYKENYSSVKIEGPINRYNGNDIFKTVEVGWPICLPWITKLLEREEIQVFEKSLLRQLLLDQIEDAL